MAPKRTGSAVKMNTLKELRTLCQDHDAAMFVAATLIARLDASELPELLEGARLAAAKFPFAGSDPS